MKKIFLRITSGILVFLSAFYFFTISVSSVDFISSSKPFVTVICGNYSHTFSTVDYGFSMSRTLVQALGIAGKKASDDRQAYVYVSKGDYRLHNTLLIYSNTTLVADGASFSCYGNMLRNGYGNGELTAEKYYGSKNIAIIGGIWNMETPYEYADTSNLLLTHSTFRLAHCKNITIKNCTFKNNYNSHDIELGGVYNANITGCEFVNDKTVNIFEKTNGREAIQIDVNTEKAVPYLAEYDYTQCQNITVSDCHFKNKFRGIGSHHGVIGNPYNKIKICNNKFENISAVAVSGIYWNNAEIYNNSMNNVGSGIEVYSVSNLSSKNLINYMKLTYNETLNTVRNSILYIYGNEISVREDNNHLKKTFGIKVSGSNYKEYDSETDINKGLYPIFNVKIGTKFPNVITGNIDKDIILSYNQ